MGQKQISLQEIPLLLVDIISDLCRSSFRSMNRSELPSNSYIKYFGMQNFSHYFSCLVVYTSLPDCHLVSRSYSLPVALMGDAGHYLSLLLARRMMTALNFCRLRQ